MSRRRSAESEITTAREAANDKLVLAFGHLQGAANRLEYLLGRALEEDCGINHLTFEVLMILGRAGHDGLPMRSIGQERVLSTGGATRLVDRMEATGLVIRSADATTAEAAASASPRPGRTPPCAPHASTPRTFGASSSSHSPKSTARSSSTTCGSSATAPATRSHACASRPTNAHPAS